MRGHGGGEGGAYVIEEKEQMAPMDHGAVSEVRWGMDLNMFIMLVVTIN